MGRSRTAAYHTLGCKLNFAETSTLARSLEEAGYARVRLEDRPDVFVLNTCSVTENADKECRQWVRRFQRINPEAFVAVVGCYAQLKPQEIAAIPGVDLVLGASEKFDLAAHIDQLGGKQAEGQAIFGAIKEVKRFVPSHNEADRTRTFLKVQDGCDYFCSFCTIPLARGRSRSGTIAETVAIAERIAASGVQEIVLTGVNTGDFGRHAVTSSAVEKENFLGLIEALDRMEGIARFRISSIEPNLCSDAIIRFVAGSRRFAPHFHMPLQSGSDALLQRMRRRYDTALYAERVHAIKQLMPHACIGADVITGTPGETEEEFLKTHAFLRSIPVDYLHVFTYSERANTTAVRMDDSVPIEVRRERTKQLRILSNKLHRAFLDKHLGTTRPVLFEAEEVDGRMLGFTDNYVRVSAPYDDALVNTVVPVSLDRIDGEGHVTGTLIVPASHAVAPSEGVVPASHAVAPSEGVAPASHAVAPSEGVVPASHAVAPSEGVVPAA
ncbi:MAG: tRNA (N(6)-L-threonylcarbamoyladenosine(37)-C(2))-methylthiotransferase MtaB [Flavobacteriales bacterium]|nr:tRNA (N(6)-L-threonylcarbamoyladenosine(37)-C(2))-methylthiotransferase MtaB [Flavobacteriales bacterium]